MYLSSAQIKMEEISILNKIVDVCKSYKLRYYLAYGTLLGAVRHSGFIPWDDDIDIFMPYCDFLKLEEIFRNDSDYGFQSYFTDSNYCSDYGKVFSKKIIIKEDNVIVPTKGLFVDVFPLFPFGCEKIEAEKVFKKAGKIKKFFSFSNVKYSKINSFHSILKNIFLFINRFRFFVLGKRRIMKKFFSIFNNISYENSKYVGYLSGYRKFSKTKSFFSKELFENTSKYIFENAVYDSIADYDYFLSNYYYNYMELPPDSERKSHSIIAEYLKL